MLIKKVGIVGVVGKVERSLQEKNFPEYSQLQRIREGAERRGWGREQDGIRELLHYDRVKSGAKTRKEHRAYTSW